MTAMLIALPLLPMVLAAALIRDDWRPMGGWLVATAATAALATAASAPDLRVDLPGTLLNGEGRLVLDATSRPALLLYGGVWLAAGLGMARRPELSRQQAPTLLLTLAAAVTFALADGGPLLYTAAVATGYGLYAVLVAAAGAASHRSGRTLVVLLVVSDLLVFEALLTMAKGDTHSVGLLAMVLAALVARSAVPPAHLWLPPALVVATPGSAVVLTAVPMTVGLVAGLGLLPASAPWLSAATPALALTGTAYALVAGFAQGPGRATIAYAIAASAALLLLPLAAGPDGHSATPWLMLALAAASASAVAIAVRDPSWARTAVLITTVAIHALATAQLVDLNSPSSTWLAAWLSAAAVAASALFTLGAYRWPPEGIASGWEGGLAVAVLLGLAALGLGLGLEPDAAIWPGVLGVLLGLAAVSATRRGHQHLPVGDVLVPLETILRAVGRAAYYVCTHPLQHSRDRLWLFAVRGIRTLRWHHSVDHMETILRTWATVSILVLVFAVCAALLLRG